MSEAVVQSAWDPSDVIPLDPTAAQRNSRRVWYENVHRGFSHDLCDYLVSVELIGRRAGAQAAPSAPNGDTVRIDWLAEQASKRGPVSSYNVESPPLVAAIAYDTKWTLREAIDQARDVQ